MEVVISGGGGDNCGGGGGLFVLTCDSVIDILNCLCKYSCNFAPY